jgi:hypothetical protein
LGDKYIKKSHPSEDVGFLIKKSHLNYETLFYFFNARSNSSYSRVFSGIMARFSISVVVPFLSARTFNRFQSCFAPVSSPSLYLHNPRTASRVSSFGRKLMPWLKCFRAFSGWFFTKSAWFPFCKCLFANSAKLVAGLFLKTTDTSFVIATGSPFTVPGAHFPLVTSSIRMTSRSISGDTLLITIKSVICPSVVTVN